MGGGRKEKGSESCFELRNVSDEVKAAYRQRRDGGVGGGRKEIRVYVMFLKRGMYCWNRS